MVFYTVLQGSVTRAALTCVEDVSAGVQDTGSSGRLHHRRSSARVVEEVLRVEQQVQILGGLRQEKRLHTIVQGVCPHVFHLS